MPNNLQKETSPYLLQHQNNPVDWYPWHPDSLKKASTENKLMLVSIGYAACHWCHVMERESFEDAELAALLNAHFVSIKVDREERPDIDQLYMLALQLISGQGGWPLNMICLPDGRPVYGGTYFRKDDFKAILTQLQDKWVQDPEEMFAYAARLTQGVQDAESFKPQQGEALIDAQLLDELVMKWSSDFDLREGGFKRVPKFPLPSAWRFLLHYGHRHKHANILNQVHHTLDQMSRGGIYDQIAGGFARYSVDGQWKVPHFEKMLYDNALLISLYSEAYAHRPQPRYQSVIEESISWLLRDMKAPQGGFYCALDADSEGEEGKFYTFTYSEFVEALGGGDAIQSCAAYFKVSEKGNWEEANTNVLQANTALDIPEIAAYKAQLLAYRSKRTPPALDNKILCSWNALLVSGLCSAYAALGKVDYLQEARELLSYIGTHLVEANGKVLRLNPQGGRKVAGFLDDYAFYVKALLDYYQVSFDEQAAEKAYAISKQVIEDFYDKQAGVFYYTAKDAEPLIARKAELMDDVIPSSNSVLILQLDKLGVIFDDVSFENMAKEITQHIIPQLKQYPSVFPVWMQYLDTHINGRYEIALCGPQYAEMQAQVLPCFLPGKILMGGADSKLPFLQGKVHTHNQAYLCQNKTCSAPVATALELLNLIRKSEQNKDVPKKQIT